MDFGKINLKKASAEGAECHLNDPVYGTPLYTDKGEKISITVLGRDSDEFHEVMAVMSERGPVNSFSKEAEVSSAEVIAAMITGWKNVVWNGSELECTRENAMMLLQRFEPIRIQLDIFIGKRANFFDSAKKK